MRRALHPAVWGKTLSKEFEGEYYPLMAHLLDTATVATILWKHWLRPGLKERLAQEAGQDFGPFLALAAGLHDLGKCTPIFQGGLLGRGQDHGEVQATLEEEGFTFPRWESVGSARGEKLHRHEKLGCYSLNENMNLPQEESKDHWLELAILGHHGSFELNYGGFRSRQEDKLQETLGSKWREEQALLRERLEEGLEVTVAEARSIELSPEAIVLVSGLIILADRIASHEESIFEGQRLLKAQELSIDKAKEWLIKRSHFLQEHARKELGFAPELTQKEIMGTFAPRGVQKLTPDARGLWLAMAPTGAGKTEAALLRHSKEKENLIFLLPTLATTNAMMKRLEATFAQKESTTAVLGHGLSFLEDFYARVQAGVSDEQDDCGLTPTAFSGVKGARLSATVNVATIDQMLVGGLPLKWTHLRWLLLANSHIVIDEAHLIDFYQVKLLSPLLTWLGKVDARVTILSATLPTWLEQEFLRSYGLSKREVKSLSTTFPSSVLLSSHAHRRSVQPIEVESYGATIAVETGESLEALHCSWAEAALQKYPQARLGVFVNQVKRAQAIALELRRRLPDDVIVLCLHSRMLARHRKKITEELLALCSTQEGQGKRLVVVGTQVMEMSLDIDLDLMSTDLCPAPSLIQRMGRVWRDRSNLERFTRIAQEDFPHMPVAVFVPFKAGELDAKKLLPYGEALVGRTYEWLQAKKKLHFPEELQEFVETVYLRADAAVSKADLNEKGDEFYRSLTGSQRAIDYELFSSPGEDTVGAFTSLTENEGGDDMATRLIEGNSEVFLLKTADPELIQLGALSIATAVENLGHRRAQESSVGLSYGLAKLFEERGLERLQLPKSYSYGFQGELPVGVSYSKLVGLLEEETQ